MPKQMLYISDEYQGTFEANNEFEALEAYAVQKGRTDLSERLAAQRENALAGTEPKLPDDLSETIAIVERTPVLDIYNKAVLIKDRSDDVVGGKYVHYMHFYPPKMDRRVKSPNYDDEDKIEAVIKNNRLLHLDLIDKFGALADSYSAVKELRLYNTNAGQEETYPYRSDSALAEAIEFAAALNPESNFEIDEPYSLSADCISDLVPVLNALDYQEYLREIYIETFSEGIVIESDPGNYDSYVNCVADENEQIVEAIRNKCAELNIANPDILDFESYLALCDEDVKEIEKAIGVNQQEDPSKIEAYEAVLEAIKACTKGPYYSQPVEYLAEAVNALPDLNWHSSSGMSFLMEAAHRGARPEIINLFVEKGMDVNDVDLNGRSALYFAASVGAPDTCDALIKAGARLNIVSNDGLTPLLADVERGYFWRSQHIETAQVLLNGGANPFVGDVQTGMTLRSWVLESGFVEDLQPLKEYRCETLISMEGLEKYDKRENRMHECYSVFQKLNTDGNRLNEVYIVPNSNLDQIPKMGEEVTLTLNKQRSKVYVKNAREQQKSNVLE